MIAVDTNILVYAHREDSSFHDTARRVVTELAESGANWCIAMPCIHEFLSVVSNPRIFKTPTPIDKAIVQVDYWLESSTLRLLSESSEYWSLFRQKISRGKVAGPKIHDARVFFICQEHGVRTIWSADRDFSRFSGVKIVNPLI